MFSILIDASDLRRAGGQFASFDKLFRADIDDVMENVIGPSLVQKLSLETPRSEKEGEHAADLWSSRYVGSFSRGAGTIEATNGADYLRFVISGVSQHPIEGNPLAFYNAATGDFVITRAVMHPGFGPNDFIKQVAEERLSVATGMIAASVALSLRRTIR